MAEMQFTPVIAALIMCIGIFSSNLIIGVDQLWVIPQ